MPHVLQSHSFYKHNTACSYKPFYYLITYIKFSDISILSALIWVLQSNLSKSFTCLFQCALGIYYYVIQHMRLCNQKTTTFIIELTGNIPKFCLQNLFYLRYNIYFIYDVRKRNSLRAILVHLKVAH